MEATFREFKVALAWELLFADDLVVIAENEDNLIKSLNEWMDTLLENRGMRVNINKTKGENIRIGCGRLQDGRVVYVVGMLVIIQYSLLVVRIGYTRSIVVSRVACPK